jgi:hypothetical protein
METQVAAVLQRQKIAEDKVQNVQHEMSHLLDRAIAGSRQAATEAREETVREYVLREIRILRRHRPTTRVEDLVERLRDKVPIRRVVMELERMRTEGLLALSTEVVGPETEVTLRGSESLPRGIIKQNAS